MTQCDASLHFFFHYATTVASVLEVKLVTLNDSMVHVQISSTYIKFFLS